MRKTNRRGFLKLACGTGAGALALPFIRSSSLLSAAGKPNLLIILTDQQREQAHFPEGVSFPNWDRLREAGISFSRYHGASAPCTPSRANIFTGQHSRSVNMIDNLNFGYVDDMAEEIPTLGTMLQEAGYYTAYKGKWHLHDILDVGCEDVDTVDALASYGFTEYNPCGDFHGAPWGGVQHDREIAKAAVEWLQERAPVIVQTQPFCLVVSFINPHDIMFYDADGFIGPVQVAQGNFPILPHPPAPPYFRDWDPDPPSSLYDDDLSTKPWGQQEFKRVIDYLFGSIPVWAKPMWERYINYYINCMLDVDYQMGLVLDALDASGFGENTIIVASSDHGELGGVHGGLRQKGPCIYRENLNLPLTIVHPDVAGGTTSDALFSSVDLVPTLMSLVGVGEAQLKSWYPEVIGYDMSGSLTSTSSVGARASSAAGVLFTYDGYSTVDLDYTIAITEIQKDNPGECVVPGGTPNLDNRGFLRGLFDGRYKFARYFSHNGYNRPTTLGELRENNDLELYDTEADPDENYNLAYDPAFESLLESMSNALEGLIDQEIQGDDTGYPVPDFSQCDQFDTIAGMAPGEGKTSFSRAAAGARIGRRIGKR